MVGVVEWWLMAESIGAFFKIIKYFLESVGGNAITINRYTSPVMEGARFESVRDQGAFPI